jgi:hypothetical protein
MDFVSAELTARNLIGRYADAIHRRSPADWQATLPHPGEQQA